MKYLKQILSSQPLQEIVDEAISDPENINLRYAASKNWCVVPVESACHFNREDANLSSDGRKTPSFRSGMKGRPFCKCVD